MTFRSTAEQWSRHRSKLVKFQLIYHDGRNFLRGSITDLLVSTTDSADTVTCRVLKVFSLPGETHSLMHFTAPKVAGKRIVPNFYGIHDYTEVYVHVRMIERPGLDVVRAGAKRLGLDFEDDLAHDLKSLCFSGAGERGGGGEKTQAAEDWDEMDLS